MSAAIQKPGDTAQEPSMEEILASIRRIIADDQTDKPEARDAVPEPQNDDVLDLADIAQPVPQRPVEPGFRPAAMPLPIPDPASERDELAFEPAAPPRRADPLEAAVEREAVDRLVSRATDDDVGRAFNLLSRTVLSQNARTLEDLVTDMLRPMLREWLDDNLPSMVERLVRAEIERVARGR